MILTIRFRFQNWTKVDSDNHCYIFTNQVASAPIFINRITVLVVSISISQHSPLICVVIFYVCGHLTTPSFYHFWSTAYFSNHSLFSREHIFVGFNEFLSLVCWSTVIHHHRPQGPTLFRIARWDFTCCAVCAITRDLLF